MALVACGGDSGTSANNDKDTELAEVSSSSQKAVSSSSVKASSSSVKVSSSSSVILNSSEGSSASRSSSSQKIASSSSSVKTTSSSSVAPASSSSKKVESSSSEYVPFDHSKTHAADWEIGENRYKTFVDPRNGRSYYYITIPGTNFKENANGKVTRIKDTVTVMAENLNIGEMVLGTDEQNDDNKIERYCYNNDTTKCDEFGGLYQWAEMMQLPSRCNTESCADLIQENHRGICPEGWRLMTWSDYKIIENADGNEEHGIAGLRSGYRFSGYNTTGFSLVGAGKREKNGKFSRLEEVAYWFYPLEDDYDRSIYAHFAYIAMSGAYGVGADNGDEKTYGLSVRCVKLE
jgi:uncharacterized protein (TIGR02145 family)